MNLQSKSLSSLLVVIMLIISGCSRNPVTGKREVMLMSESQEIALGKENDPMIVATYGEFKHPQLENFINTKGQQMVKISHRPDLPFTFRILDSPVVNAFALPGGYVYFTRGILAHFNNEAEFAGVLGHEIGHVTARHSAQQYSQQMLGNIALIGGLLVSEDFRNFAQEAQQAMGLLFLKFGRDDESQSDELGVEYSTAIGYDAVKMAEFYKTLERLQENSGANLPTFLSTHPNPANRYENVSNYAQELKAKNPSKNYKVNRDAYLAMIDGMIYGDDPKQGFVENGKFYHPELKFEFVIPTNWRLNNTPSMVQMAPEDGNAVITFSLAQGNSLQAAAQEWVSNNQINVVEQSTENVNGNQALALIGDVTSQDQSGQTQSIRMLTYFISYDGMIYLFNGYSMKNNFNQYFNLFKNSMVSFKQLTNTAMLNKKPIRVDIVTVKSTGSFASALRAYGISSSADIREHEVLNGIEPNATVNAGKKIKILVEGAGS